MGNKLHLKSYLMILISAVGFGSYGIWSRLMGQEFGIFFQAWVRSGLILIFLIPIGLITKSFKKVERADIKWLLASVLFGAATQAPLYYAYNHMDIGTTTLIFYSMYLITSYIVGTFFLREKIGYLKIISLLLAFMGLAMIFGFSLMKFSILALILALINGIASGGEVSFTKKSTDKYSSIQISVYVWLGIFLTHLPISLIIGEKQIPFNILNGTWLAMLAYALVGLTAFWLVIEGYRRVDASIGGLIGLMEIIFGVVFGILFFHERLTVLIVTGGLLIIFAAMLPDLVNIIRSRKSVIGLNSKMVD
jgi:drug/metabolite transporter (DMT)-like permease